MSVNLTAGDGTIVAATDNIAGVAWPTIKIAYGSAGSATLVSAAAPLPVDASSVAVPVTDNGGALTVDGSLTAVTTVTTVTAVTDITNAVKVKGSAAVDAALSDAPVPLGGRATNTNLAKMSTDGDAVYTTHTMQGAIVTNDAPRELLDKQVTTITTSTSETTIVTAGASGIFNDVYSIRISNTGGTAVGVTIKDATGGSTADYIYVPAGDIRGWTLPAGSAVPQASAANNWTATCSNSSTTVQIVANYVKRK